jgi:hypothetical protein
MFPIRTLLTFQISKQRKPKSYQNRVGTNQYDSIMSHPPDPPRNGPIDSWHVVQHGPSPLHVEKGVKFGVRIETDKDSKKYITNWWVNISQGKFRIGFPAANHNSYIACPGNSGKFKVKISATGPNMPIKKLKHNPDFGGPDIDCPENCAAGIIIYPNEDGTDAFYYIRSPLYRDLW